MLNWIISRNLCLIRFSLHGCIVLFQWFAVAQPWREEILPMFYLILIAGFEWLTGLWPCQRNSLQQSSTAAQMRRVLPGIYDSPMTLTKVAYAYRTWGAKDNVLNLYRGQNTMLVSLVSNLIHPLGEILFQWLVSICGSHKDNTT